MHAPPVSVAQLKEGRFIMTLRNPRKYLCLAEAADLHGVSQRTIRRWIAEGRITGYRVGPRVIRVSADELEQLARPIPTGDAPFRQTA
jgi:excisionase family DNA binding protein